MVSARSAIGWMLLVPLSSLWVPHRAMVGGAAVSPQVLAIGDDRLVARRHFLTGYPARNPDASVNAVVEIPAGTVGKFEVTGDGVLIWERDRDTGDPREVDYLPYPVNYGMVPRTLADDGDALDVIVLGRAIERGHVARTRVIGVLAMANGEVRDDKLIAVPIEPAWSNGFSRMTDVAELDTHYPATRHILELWFSHYWGKGATRVLGWADAAEARAVLARASERFELSARVECSTAPSTPPT